jgi:hypothetical protein
MFKRRWRHIVFDSLNISGFWVMRGLKGMKMKTIQRSRIYFITHYF